MGAVWRSPVINYDPSYAAKPHHVVPDETHVMVRLLFVFKAGQTVDCEARIVGAKVASQFKFD